MTEQEVRAIVRRGGGCYCGKQLRRDGSAVALFNAPDTGSTLSLPWEEVTVKRVRDRITEHRVEWARRT